MYDRRTRPGNMISYGPSDSRTAACHQGHPTIQFKKFVYNAIEASTVQYLALFLGIFF
jgi:hypothetical protein